MISVCILTRDSAAHIEAVLTAVDSFPEVVILDSGSRDATLDIAAGHGNVAIHRHEFDGFGAMKNRAAALAANDWVFLLDSDEVPTSALAAEILALELDPALVYAVNRRNRFRGRWIRGGGFWPDWTTRLYHRRHARVSDRPVHEAVEHPGLEVVRLGAPLDHYTYDSVADYRRKAAHYADLHAAAADGPPPSALTPWVQGVWAFLRDYVLRHGFVDGMDGLLLAGLAAEARYRRYAALRARAR